MRGMDERKGETVGTLHTKLTLLIEAGMADLPVWTEGCDCFAGAFGVQVQRDEVGKSIACIGRID